MNISFEDPISPPRIFLYGPPGSGKTTFACSAPAPVVLRAEDGLVGLVDPLTGQKLRVGRTPVCQSFGDILTGLKLIYDEPACLTCVVDTADWVELLIHQEIMIKSGKESVATSFGGYGAGYQAALKHWRQVLAWLKAIHAQGKAVIITGHADIEKHESPDLPAYDMWVPKLHKLSRALLTEWADVVAFSCQKVRLKEVEGEERKLANTAMPDERILRCSLNAGTMSKNRYRIPPEIPCLWQAFAPYLTA